MAIAIAAAMYLIGSCCCANCGGEYGFWNDDSFASDIIRNRKTCSYHLKRDKSIDRQWTFFFIIR